MSVGKKFAVQIEDLGGGLNEGAPASLEDRQWSNLSNFHPFGSRIERRGGLTAITTTPYSTDLTSLFAYKRAVGEWLLLVGLANGIGKLSGGTVVPLSSSDTYASLAYPWIMRQYKDEVFACRPYTGTLKRVTADFMHNAGIAPPATAATISEGGAGSKEAGNRQLVYTFYVKETGSESNPSPVSNTLNLSADKELVANGVALSTNPQVNARRVYETAPNQEGEYYFVQQIDDNVGTGPFTNDKVQDDLGRSASFEYGLPPEGIIAIEIALERMFATDGNIVYYSKPGLMQAFSEYDFQPVMEDDGHKIIDLVAWGDVVAVPKTGGMYALRGVGPNAFGVTVVSDKHGARGFSTKSAEGVLLWYSGENLYRSDGTSPSSISTLRVRKTLDRIPNEYKDKVVAAVLPRQSLYLLGVPLDSATEISHYLAYNYKTDAWDTATPAQAATFFDRFYDTNFNEVLYGTFPDKRIYQLECGNTDGGTSIVALAKTKALEYGQGPGKKAVSVIGVNTPAVNATMKVRVYNNGQATHVKEKTIDLSTDGWKRVNCSTRKRLASSHQIEFEYSGTPPLEIHSIEVEGVMFPGRRPKAQ
ncbi:MAG TPA: hypothetical protein VMZ92_08895 [Planctomycetota bacterium]|nr:hypothetical protein [Planctomycetota bacterium]